jgi:hypothetical protein
MEPASDKIFQGLTKDEWLTRDRLFLGTSMFSRSLSVYANELNILSDLVDPATSIIDQQFGRIRLYGNEIIIHENVKLESAKIFLFANQTIRLEKGVYTQSLIRNECNMDDSENKDIYRCADFDQDHD